MSECKFYAKVQVNERQLERLHARFPLLALDPGSSIGTAFVFVPDDAPAWEEFMLTFVTATLQWPHDAAHLAEWMMRAKSLAIEGFQVFPKTSAAGPIANETLSPVEVRGFVRGLLASTHSHLGLSTIQPSQSKGMWTNDGMRESLGGELPASPHQKDALRIALFHLFDLMTTGGRKE